VVPPQKGKEREAKGGATEEIYNIKFVDEDSKATDKTSNVADTYWKITLLEMSTGI